MSLVLLLLSTLLLCPLIYYLLSSFRGRRKGSPLPLPPGPKGWPIVGNLPHLGPQPHHSLQALSKLHGPLVYLRLGSVDTVVACSAAVAAEFLKTHDAKFCDRPPNSGAEHLAYNYQDLVFAPYGARWRALRKLCTVHLFSTKALDDLRPVREGELARLARGLAKHGGEPVAVGKAVNSSITNALSRALVGRRVFEEEEEAGEFKEMVVELLSLGAVFNVGDFVPGIGWMDLQGVVGRMKRLHSRFDAFVDGLIAEHREARGGEGGGRDILSAVLGLKEEESVGEGVKLTDTNVKALLLNLFVAGTDTSSISVEWALAELIRQPGLLARAQREIDSVVGRARLVSESDLPNLPVLQAVIKETLRLHPSTPMSLPRLASEECNVAGYRVPAGVTLLVNVWAIGRDPATWPDPLEFRPDRFLPGGDHEHIDVRGNDFELIPFGAGRRICPGMGLGTRMVQLVTATLVHAFDWALPDGQTPEELDMEEAYELALHRAVPLVLHPTPRLDPIAFGSACNG